MQAPPQVVISHIDQNSKMERDAVVKKETRITISQIESKIDYLSLLDHLHIQLFCFILSVKITFLPKFIGEDNLKIIICSAILFTVYQMLLSGFELSLLKKILKLRSTISPSPVKLHVPSIPIDFLNKLFYLVELVILAVIHANESLKKARYSLKVFGIVFSIIHFILFMTWAYIWTNKKTKELKMVFL